MTKTREIFGAIALNTVAVAIAAIAYGLIFDTIANAVVIAAVFTAVGVVGTLAWVGLSVTEEYREARRQVTPAKATASR